MLPEIPNQMTALRNERDSLVALLASVAWIWTHAPASTLRFARRAAKNEGPWRNRIHALIAAAQEHMPDCQITEGEAAELKSLIDELGEAGREAAASVRNSRWLLFQLRQLRARLLI